MLVLGYLVSLHVLVINVLVLFIYLGKLFILFLSVAETLVIVFVG